MVNDPDDIQAQINALREGAKAHRSDTELNRADIDHLLKTGYIDREDIDRLQIDSEVDRHLIAELQADGVLRAEHAAQMEQALVAARVIGAAIGIVMVDRHCSQLEGFEILRKISQDSNRKLRLVADHVVLTGEAAVTRATIAPPNRQGGCLGDWLFRRRGGSGRLWMRFGRQGSSGDPVLKHLELLRSPC